MSEPWDKEQDDPSWTPLVNSRWFPIVLMTYIVALLSSAIITFGQEHGFIVAMSVPLIWAGLSRHRRTRLRVLFLGLAFMLLLTLLLPEPGHPKVSYDISQSKNNLKQIGLALHNYHDTYRTYPPAFIADEDGRPKHSWRVLILPYLEQQSLYEKYDFSEAWDGPHNREIGKQVVEAFSDPVYQSKPSTAINYLAVVGPHTAWPGANSRTRSIEDFPDGTSNSVLAIEASAVSATWIEPRDLTLEEAIEALSKPDPDGAWSGNWRYDVYLGRQVLFADGTVRRFEPISREAARVWLTIDDGKTPDDVPTSSPVRRYHPFKFARRFARKLGEFGIFLIVAFLPSIWKFLRRRRSTSTG